jgi:putative transferase (TIGR04331 family)
MSNNLTLLQCSHVERQYELIRGLLAALPSEIVSATLLRPKASNATKPARAQSSDFDQFRIRVRVNDGESTLVEDLEKSRLAVVLYNETTLPTNLSLDYPTIALWDHRLTRLNRLAQSAYGSGGRLSPIQSSAESCASLIATHWNAVDEWWSSHDVRLVSRAIANTYARRVDAAVRITAVALKRVVA